MFWLINIREVLPIGRPTNLVAPKPHITSGGELSLRSTGRRKQVDACIVLTGHPGNRDAAAIRRPRGRKPWSRMMRQAKRFLGSNRFHIEVVSSAVVLAVPRKGDLAAVGRKCGRRYITRQRSEWNYRQLLELLQPYELGDVRCCEPVQQASKESKHHENR